MNRDYANHDSAGWIRRQYSHPLGLSPLGEQVAHVLGVVGGGIYNAPINIERVNWYDTHYVRVPWRGSMANWDSPRLAILLIECHRRMMRVEVSPCNMQHIEMTFHQRNSRNGGTAERLPDMHELIATIEGWYAPIDSSQS